MPDEQHRTSNGELSRLVYKHDTDLYYGNGKPGLTIRMALMESALDRISRNLNKIVWLLLGGMMTGGVAIIVALVTKR